MHAQRIISNSKSLQQNLTGKKNNKFKYQIIVIRQSDSV